MMRGVWAVVIAALLCVVAFASIGAAAPVRLASEPAPQAIMTLDVGTAPFGDAWNAASDAFFIADDQSDSVVAVGATNFTLFATITVGAFPQDVLDIEHGTLDQIWVSSGAGIPNDTAGSSNLVTVIDANNLTIVKTVHVGTDPNQLCYWPANNTVWVTDRGSNQVSVISTTTDAVVKTVHTGASPIGCGSDLDDSNMWIGDYGANAVQVFGAANYSLLATVGGLNGAGAGISHTDDRQITGVPEGQAYVSDYNAGFVTFIDDDTFVPVANVSVGAHPFGIGLDLQTGMLVVPLVTTNEVVFVDIATRSVAALVPTGEYPIGVQAYDPQDGLFAVANLESGSITIIADGTGGCSNLGTNYNVATSACGSTPGSGSGGGVLTGLTWYDEIVLALAGIGVILALIVLFDQRRT
jgi:YVTN family beta-propeller protein